MPNTALILGSSGHFGHHAADAFAAAGWTVRRFRRGDDLIAAARGANVIVNGWNPPYPEWSKTVPGLTRRVILAARTSGATVIVPGNVYPFGAEASETFGPDTPHGATNALGRVRAEMEAEYRISRVRTIILRAGDFIDTTASGNWFDTIITAKSRKGRFTYPGPLDRDHAWAYLPDIARAAVALAEMGDVLPVFADIPFPGYTLTGDQLMNHVAAATGVPQRHRRFAWWLISALRPVWPMARGLWQMRYLWSNPHHLDGSAFDRLLPGFAMTPPATAIAAALEVDVDPHKAMARRGGDQRGEVLV